MSTIAWDLPRPYEEELGYSIVARFLHRWGYLHAGPMLTRHLPNSHRRCTIEAGPHLETVASALRERHGLTCSYVDRFTLLPYFLALLEKSQKQRFIHDIVDDNLCGQSPRLTVYIAKNTDTHFLRFCPECQVEQRRNHGEYYWTRQHQLPRAQFCLTHECRTYQSTISRSERILRAPDPSNCITSPNRLEPLNLPRSVSLALCMKSDSLLKDPPKSGFISRAGYRRLIIDNANLGFRASLVNSQKLNWAMLEFLGQARVGHEGLIDDWWVDLYRKHSRTVSVSQHLLFRMFLTSRHTRASNCSKKGILS